MAATTKTHAANANSKAATTHQLLGDHRLLGRQYGQELAGDELTEEDDEDEERLFAKLAESADHHHHHHLDSKRQNTRAERKATGTKEKHARFRSSSSSVSPSSLQSLTTDSDSLQGEPQQQQQVSLAANRSVISPQPSSGISSGSPNGGRVKKVIQTSGERSQQVKSPILIKYNYYDYNGERQENHDIHLQNYHGPAAAATGRTGSGQPVVQRTLSPTFQASLDQIVRSSQAHSAAQRRQQMSPSPPSSAGTASPPSSSPEHNRPNQQNPYTMTLLARRYKPSSYEHRCLRCAKTVYQMDKVGPLKDFTFYHQNCFKCRECGTKLTLKTYFNNQHSSTDQEVYCHRHCPKTPAGRLDNQSVGIRAALNAPKVFDPTVHQSPSENHHHHHLQAVAQYYSQVNQPFGQQQHPQVDSRALYIQHAVRQTKLQANYKPPPPITGGGGGQVSEKISQFLNRRLEYLEPKQKMLEARHRLEEEQLFKVFEQKWLQEESCIRDQIRDEWQRELSKLFEKHKQQMSPPPVALKPSINNNNNNNVIAAKSTQIDRLPTQTSKPPRLDFHRGSAATGGPTDLSTATNEDQQEKMLIELERMNLEKTMTLKLDRKKETLKRKLREFERQATAELVEKQSREMLQLISLKLEEFKEEQRRKIGSDLEHFEAIESLANHLGASLQVDGGHNSQVAPPAVGETASKGSSSRSSPRPLAAAAAAAAMVLPKSSSGHAGRAGAKVSSASAAAAPPLPKAPLLSKMELYNSEQPDEVFRDIDELAINVAKEDQRTFTDLVHHLTRHCLTDVEKVRAIFRWITVKNLNTMHFDSSVKPDTPLGLLRGIKQGSESYHVLFKRLCSYAGLHCVVIKGYSKSAGYQPGVRFEGNRFRNSWNAVYVAGAWRFVQCNWGARHLVSVAVMQDRGSSSSNGHNNSHLKDSHTNSQPPVSASGRSSSHQHAPHYTAANLGRRGQAAATGGSVLLSPVPMSPTSSSPRNQQVASVSPPSTSAGAHHLSTKTTSNQTRHAHGNGNGKPASTGGASSNTTAIAAAANDSLRYEYDDHYFLTDPDEFIYEFLPLAPEWQLLKSAPISLSEFEQLPFVRSLFFKYGLYFPQQDIRSVLYTNSSGATTIKIGMPTHMIPSLIFHYNLKYFDSDCEHSLDGISLKRFVMQSVESGTGTSSGGGNMLSNIVSFRVHVPENGSYILDIFANSTTPDQYITGEPMKFKSVCKFKIIARHLRSVMVPLPDCASGEYGPMKATRLFGIIPLTHETGLISVPASANRQLEIQFRMTRPLLDFMASLHKNGHADERQLAKLIKIYIEGDIVYIAIKFQEDGQYGLDIYTRDQAAATNGSSTGGGGGGDQERREQGKKQLLTHCCKYLINVRTTTTIEPK